ncbi:MAG: hypothetical protein M1829_001779 [Trizodia sp. TS-e1964]|nr:MAG: hypothetical protein M1829_001779 [Trizodia sp. TS-e1964]
MAAPKPRRATRSCDLCKRLKIKCEKDGPKCSHCLARNVECILSLTEKKRPERRKKRADYVSAVESRIKRMEALLSQSRVIRETKRPIDNKELLVVPNQDEPVLIDQFSNLLINEKGEARGIKWVHERLDCPNLINSFNSLCSEPDSKPSWIEFGPNIWRPIHDSIREPLPSREEAQVYVDKIPLYDRATFDELFEKQYSSTPPLSVSWYASLNLVLTNGCLIKWASTPRSDEQSMVDCKDKAWKYFRNASSLFLDLLYRDPDLLAVQAMLAMGFIMQMMPNPLPAYILTSTAVRQAYGMGLHRQLVDFGLTPRENKQRRLVFWVTYIFDKCLSFRLGRPSNISDEDIGVGLPGDHQDDDVDCYDDDGKSSIFRSRCTLAILESKIQSELYSARSMSRSTQQRQQTIAQLDLQLQQWRDSVSLSIRPEHVISCDSTKLMSAILLHLMYYQCCCTLHRASCSNSSPPGEDEEDENEDTSIPQLNPRVYLSAALCISAARSMVNLLSYIDHDNNDPRHALIWISAYYPLSACICLFGNVLQNPQDKHSESDVRLINVAIDFLSGPMAAAIGNGVQMLEKLASIATAVIQREREKASTPNTLPTLGSGSDKQMSITPDSAASEFFDFGAALDLDGSQNSFDYTHLFDASPSSEEVLGLDGVGGLMPQGAGGDDPNLWLPPLPFQWDLSELYSNSEQL